MADADDSVSMAGAASGQFPWGRAALQFAGISIAEHEVFAQKLGVGVVGEVLLLIISRQCGADPRRCQRARDAGIPWQEKRWSSLSALQGGYNDAVAKALELDSFVEDAALSGSSARNASAGDARSSTPPGALQEWYEQRMMRLQRYDKEVKTTRP